jgi:hypothetical protein
MIFLTVLILGALCALCGYQIRYRSAVRVFDMVVLIVFLACAAYVAQGFYDDAIRTAEHRGEWKASTKLFGETYETKNTSTHGTSPKGPTQGKRDQRGGTKNRTRSRMDLPHHK